MTDISLKLTWTTGSAEIVCAADQFPTVVEAAERLLAKASSTPARVTPPAGQGIVAAESGEHSPEEAKPAKPRSKRPSPRSASANSEKSKLGTARYQDYVDFKWDISDEVEMQMVQFYKEKSPKTQNDKVAVILAALKQFAGRDRASYDEIYKTYRLSDRSDPIKNVGGVVSNMQLINLVSREDDGVRLKAFGEELVDKELPRGDPKSA